MYMSQVDLKNREIQWNETGSKSHPDYLKNLDYSERLCSSLEKKLPNGEIGSKLPNGMGVKISDSEHLKKALLVISWRPGPNVKIGNYATPIYLHQYNEDFKKTTTNVLNVYTKIVEQHTKEQPSQLEFCNRV